MSADLARTSAKEAAGRALSRRSGEAQPILEQKNIREEMIRAEAKRPGDATFGSRTHTPNAPLLVRTRAHAREKSLKNFRLVPLRRRYGTTVSRARRYHTDHADVGAGLVGAAIGQR